MFESTKGYIGGTVIATMTFGMAWPVVIWWLEKANLVCARPVEHRSGEHHQPHTPEAFSNVSINSAVTSAVSSV